MSNEDRALRRAKQFNKNTCGGKSRFASYTAAKSYDNRIKGSRKTRRLGKKVEPLEPYRCENCHHWHLGHTLPEVFAAKKQQRIRKLHWEPEFDDEL